MIMGDLGKNEEKKTNLTRFYEGLVPLYMVCRLFGIFPLRPRRENDGNIEMEMHKRDLVYILCYTACYFICSTYSTYAIYADTDSYVVVPKMLVFSEVIVILVLMFTTMFFSYFFRKLLCDCVRLISDVDANFLTLNIFINYVLARKNNFQVLGVMLISVLIRTIVMGSSISVDFVQQAMLFIATFIKSLSKYEFIAFLLPITVRFNKINGAIIAYRTRKDDPELTGNLYTLCRLHFKLCNISKTLNGYFAFQLLSSLGVSLFDILFQSFYLYTILTKKYYLSTGAMIASPIVWLIDESVEIYLLVKACAAACETANSTAILLHELRNTIKENDVDTHVQMYSLQMLHQKLEFSALGFFSIDYSLLYSILGAVTTYLVIFIQFDQSKDSKEQLLKATVPPNCTFIETSTYFN